MPWDGAGELERSWRRRPPAGERHLQGSCLQSVRGRGAVLNSRRSFCPPSKLEAASEARIAPEVCGTSMFISRLFLISCLVQYWMPGFTQKRFLFASGSLLISMLLSGKKKTPHSHRCVPSAVKIFVPVSLAQHGVRDWSPCRAHFLRNSCATAQVTGHSHNPNGSHVSYML